MNWTLEVVIVPVSDVDRAKAFYSEQLGFAVDHDTRISDDARIVQLTPPGSGCSVVIGEGVVPDMPPGSLKGLQLVVPDIHKAHAELVERGVSVSDVQVVGKNPRPVENPLDNVGFVFFSDPDGEVPVLHQWRSVAALWHALPSADWFTILNTLRMRHFTSSPSEGHASLLQLEDRSLVNVGESMSFELRSNVIIGDPPQEAPLAVVNPYDLMAPARSNTGQILRSMALRVNGTAAKLSLGMLPYWEIIPTDLKSMYLDGESHSLWLHEHELTYLLMRPMDEDTERRMDAYRRIFENQGVSELNRTQIMALKQAAEDLNYTDKDTEYHSRLRDAVRDRLNFRPLWGEIDPEDDEANRVLRSLSPHLTPGTLDQLVPIPHRKNSPREETAEPPRTHFPIKVAGEDYSIIDIAPYLDTSEDEDPPPAP